MKNKVYLTSDAMVNLNREDLEFTGLGHGEWVADLTDRELARLLKVNKCELDFKGQIIDTDPDFQDTVWGTVIEVEGI